MWPARLAKHNNLGMNQQAPVKQTLHVWGKRQKKEGNSEEIAMPSPPTPKTPPSRDHALTCQSAMHKAHISYCCVHLHLHIFITAVFKMSSTRVSQIQLNSGLTYYNLLCFILF